MNAIIWALLSAFVWGIVPLFEKMGLIHVMLLTGLFDRCFGVIIGIILLGTFILKPQDIKAVDLKSVLLLILSGFLASFVAQVFFYHGLKIDEVSIPHLDIWSRRNHDAKL